MHVFFREKRPRLQNVKLLRRLVISHSANAEAMLEVFTDPSIGSQEIEGTLFRRDDLQDVNCQLFSVAMLTVVFCDCFTMGNLGHCACIYRIVSCIRRIENFTSTGESCT